MKNAIIITIVLAMVCFGTFPAWASEAGHSGHETASKGTKSPEKDKAGFHHTSVADGVRAEFQIMTLKSMNTKDADGATHHVMVKFFDEASGHQLKKAVGKIKIISPSKEEFVGALKDYNGLYATNFKADEKGKYGLICLFKINGEKQIVKFWYHNMT